MRVRLWVPVRAAKVIALVAGFVMSGALIVFAAEGANARVPDRAKEKIDASIFSYTATISFGPRPH